MCQIKETALCRFCPNIDKCREERDQMLFKLAFDWWNFDRVPPGYLRTEEVIQALLDYIHDNPEHFSGARPQN